MTGDIIIYHSEECGTSRAALAMIRAAGIEPHVVEYMKTPPNRAMLVALAARAGLSARDLLRTKEPLAREMGLAEADDAAIFDAMAAHPILLNRPLVVSPLGVRMCRPSDHVLRLLPSAPSPGGGDDQVD